MAWRIEITEGARKEIGALDRRTAKRLLRFLSERIAGTEDPRRLGEPLHGPALKAFWKYRVGDYRIIADIQDWAFIVLVVRIGSRKDVYRR